MESATMNRLLVLALVACVANAASEVQVAIEKLAEKVAETAGIKVIEKFDLCYLGMKSGLIDNDAITASSYWSNAYHPHYGRLDNEQSLGDEACWAAKINSVGQWIQVDLGTVKKIAGVVTQGRPTRFSQWVTRYKVACGNNLDHLKYVHDHGGTKVFKGNSDRDTKVYNYFPKVQYCRWVRIYPLSWHHHMSMRFDLIHSQCLGLK